MFHYYSTTFKKKSIQFLFKDLQQSYKNIHPFNSLINLNKFNYLDNKIILQYYLVTNKEKLNLFSTKYLLKVQNFFF